MDRLVQVQEREVIIDFHMACKCQTTISLKNVTHSMLVAFKVQTTSPDKFCVTPPNGFILPNADFVFHVIMKPQYQLPEHFPISKDRFLVKSILAPVSISENLPDRVPGDWFTTRTRKVFVDARLRVVYTGDLLLRYSVVKEDLASVKQILKRQSKCSDDSDEAAGRTAIHIAAADGNVEILKALLEAGGNVHLLTKKGQTPFLDAAYMGQLEAMKMLLDYGADMEAKNFRGWTAIHLASMLNHLEIMRFLIDRGANLEAKDNEARTALHCAVTEGHAECVKTLLEAGANKDACSLDGRSVLFRAAAKGNVEIVKLMMDMGANSEIKSKSGQSPFQVAMEQGHKAVLDVLCLREDLLKAARRGEANGVTASLKKGADVNGKDQWGWTGLHCASFKGHVEVVAKLLEYGADVRETDSEGHTALHCAVEAGHKEVAQLLVSKGADVHANNKKGITPLQIAAALNYRNISKFLNVISGAKHIEFGEETHQSSSISVRLASMDVPSEEKIVTQVMSNIPRFKIFESNGVKETENRGRVSQAEEAHLLSIKERGISYASGPVLSSMKLPIQVMRDTKRASSIPRILRESPAFVSTAESEPSSPLHNIIVKDIVLPPWGERRLSMSNATREAQKTSYVSHKGFAEDEYYIASRKVRRSSSVSHNESHHKQESKTGQCKQLKEFLEQDRF